MSLQKSIVRDRKGFTLMEIAVTAAIIGLLSLVSIVTISTVQKNGRDARRKADLAQIQVALERYYQRYGHYPTESLSDDCFFGFFCLSGCDSSMGTSLSGLFSSTCPQQSGTDWGGSDLDTLVTNGYLKSLPKDPLNKVSNGVSYQYIFEPDSQDWQDSEGQGTPGCNSSNPRNSCRYILQTLLENGLRTSGARGTCIYTLQGGAGTPSSWNAANCKGNAIPYGWPNGICCKQ